MSQFAANEGRAVMRTRSLSSWHGAACSMTVDRSASAAPAASDRGGLPEVNATPRACRWNRLTSSIASSLRT